MDFNQQAAEFVTEPKEYLVPDEYPETKPSKPKKKSGASAMLLYAFAGVWALYLLFGYLYPAGNVHNGGGDYGDNNFGDGGYVDNGGSLNGGATLPGNNNAEVFDDFKEDLALAADAYLSDDYVGAAIKITESLTQKYNSNNGQMLDGTNQVYENGDFSAFAQQDLSGDKGVYLWVQEKTIYIEDIKDGTTYPETNYIVTLIRVTDRTAKDTALRILQVSIPQYNLIDGYPYASVSYLETTVDEDYSSDAALLQRFSINRNDYNADEKYVRDSFAVYNNFRLEGTLTAGKFTGAATYRSDGIYLNDEKTQLAVTAEYLSYGWIYVLGSNGIIDPTAKEYLDLSNVAYQSDEYIEKWEAAIEDPDVHGIYYVDDWGWHQLHLKNTAGDANGAYSFVVYEWDDEEFPIGDILYPWSALSQHIR